MLNVSVQLDPKLVLLLREIYYLSREPFFIELPHAAKVLVESIDFNQIRTTLTRLETIVSKYNTVMRIVTPYELELFNRTLSKIWQVCRFFLIFHLFIPFLLFSVWGFCYNSKRKHQLRQPQCKYHCLIG